MNYNTIKNSDGFHVHEDFYEALINGLQSERDKEQNDYTKGKNILSKDQKRFLKRITSPIILKQMSDGGLLGAYVESRYNSAKTANLLEYQRKSYYFLKKFQELDSEVDEIEDEQSEKNKKIGFYQLYQLYRTFRKLYGIYDLIVRIKREVSQIEREPFEIQKYDLSDDAYRERLENELNVFLNSSESYIGKIMSAVMAEVTKSYIETTDRAIDRINRAIYLKLGAMAGQAIAEYAALNFIAGLLDASGAGTAVGVGLHAYSAYRFGNKAYKIGEFIGGIRRVGDAALKFARTGFGEATIRAFHAYRTSLGVRLGTNLLVDGARAATAYYDLVNISEDEFQEMEELITTTTQQQTQGVQMRIHAQLRMIQNIEVNIPQASRRGDNQNRNYNRNYMRLLQSVLTEEQNLSLFLSKRYGRSVVVKNIEGFNSVINTFDSIVKYFDNFWKNINYQSLEDSIRNSTSKIKYTNKGFSIDSDSDNGFELFFPRTLQNDSNKPSWWTDNNSHYVNTKFLTLKFKKDGEYYTYYFGGGQVYIERHKIVTREDGTEQRENVYSRQLGDQERNENERRSNVTFDRLQIDYNKGFVSGLALYFKKEGARGSSPYRFEKENWDIIKKINNQVISDSFNAFILDYVLNRRSDWHSTQLAIDFSNLININEADTSDKITNFLNKRMTELKEEIELHKKLKDIEKIVEEKMAYIDEELERLKGEVIRHLQERNRSLRASNYDNQKWEEIISTMSMSQLKSLQQKLSDIRNRNQIELLNRDMYGG